MTQHLSLPESRAHGGNTNPTRLPWILTGIASLVAIASLCLLLYQHNRKPSLRDNDIPTASRPTTTHTFGELNEDLRANYRLAKEQALKRLPYIVVVAGNDLVLWHKGQCIVERFTPDIYHSLKALAHRPLDVFVTLSEHTDRVLPDSVIARLAHTRELIQSVRARLDEEAFTDAQRTRQETILDATDRFLVQTIESKQVEPKRLDAYIHELQPLVMANAEEAARRQLDALHAVVQKWSNEHGPAFREQVHVVVMGPQAPRCRNLAVQYFARFLDRPGEGSRLVYAESIFEERKALDVLAIRLVDDQASAAFFGDKGRLQLDLLAEAAERPIPSLLPK